MFHVSHIRDKLLNGGKLFPISSFSLSLSAIIIIFFFNLMNYRILR